MSYEPRLIIKYTDLVRERRNIELSDNDEDLFIMELFRHDPFSIDLGPNSGSPTYLYSCKPELTKFNQKVRDRLDELNVKYGLDY